MCHMSRVTCHVSGVTYCVSQFFFGQSGGASLLSVCHQRGLPRPVSDYLLFLDALLV